VPVPGRVDVMIASELIEAARAAQNGFISPDRTTLIASSHRIYATSEKIHMQDGRYDAARALKAVHDLAHRAILFDMAKASEEAGTMMNAILLGALSGSGALPVEPRHWEAALASGGRASEANLKGYRLGYSAAAEGFARGEPDAAPKEMPFNPAAAEAFPVETRFIVASGAARCEDFQDKSYADDYLALVRRVCERDRELGGAGEGWRLTKETARYLALRMTYEDVMRVADLKSRASRAETIRAEARAGADQPVHVTEFLKPGPEEWGALLPKKLADPLYGWLRRTGREGRYHIGLHVKSHTVTGYSMLRLLAKLRFLRRGSWRFAEEAKLNARWLDAVLAAAAIDYEFGIEVAETADLVKGYGSTYRRGVRNFLLLHDTIVLPAIAEGVSAASDVAAARKAALADPEGNALDQLLASRAPKPVQGIAA